MSRKPTDDELVREYSLRLIPLLGGDPVEVAKFVLQVPRRIADRLAEVVEDATDEARAAKGLPPLVRPGPQPGPSDPWFDNPHHESLVRPVG